MRRQSEILLLILLFPIFLIGMLPMLVIGLLGLASLGIIGGVLMICIGLSDGLHANSDFNREIIVHGYARRSERAVHAANLHSANRFATVIMATGAGLTIAGLSGYFYFG